MTPAACHAHPSRSAVALTLRGLPVCLACACAVPTTPLHPLRGRQSRRAAETKTKEKSDERQD
jgi:hypothetical protein